ncbi:carboxypeptidase regulatory-like domain-containing protein [Pseudomonas sp. CVAP|uniref:carboxypeptidase regulatory-like domain-containing protein n=1 Tax=Pseudomonas sp. CVAP\|nr:carboxypeptidase regulatory-like domain-containing protein [Pseudomonas sp. CVAP\
MRYVHSLMLPLAAAGLLMLPVMLRAASVEPIDSSAVQVQQQQQNGITYLSGGIGEDESKAIQQTKGYNLHMTFSTGAENKYVPDVDLVIQSAPGKTVLTLTQAGPLVYVQLPAGKYTVVATRNGEVLRDTADVGNGAARNLVFHWKGNSNS